MATGRMASAAGTAVLLCFLVSRRVSAEEEEHGGGGGREEAEGRVGAVARRRLTRGWGGRRRKWWRAAQAPETWWEAAAATVETIGYAFSETLGKWPLADITFGIHHLSGRPGNLQIASVYAGDECIHLKGPEIVAQLVHFFRLLKLCLYFTKKTYPTFLELAGYSHEAVLLQATKAGFLKPSFTVVCDRTSKCIFLLIRGARSAKDRLTAATGALVPFHHLILREGVVIDLVLGYAHCGMLAAARWIEKSATPCLLKAASQYPDYNVKIIGHSLGGSIAALLTYILREKEPLSSTTCVAFGPATCMTWDLAESGKGFITSIVNCTDVVPTLSTVAVDVLRSEVTTSSWLKEMRDEVPVMRCLHGVCQSASNLGSHLSFRSCVRARDADSGITSQAVLSETQVAIDGTVPAVRAEVRTKSFSSWSCMGARRRTVGTTATTKEVPPGPCATLRRNLNSLLTARGDSEATADQPQELDCESSQASSSEGSEENKASNLRKSAPGNNRGRSPDGSGKGQLFPPGRMIHMVRVPVSDADKTDETVAGDAQAGIYEAPRHLYTKVRLSRVMINDHYMPAYLKMMQQVIDKLVKDQISSIVVKV